MSIKALIAIYHLLSLVLGIYLTFKEGVISISTLSHVGLILFLYTTITMTPPHTFVLTVTFNNFLAGACVSLLGVTTTKSYDENFRAKMFYVM